MLTRTTIVLAVLAKPFLVCNPQPTPAVTGEGSSGESSGSTEPTDTSTATETTETGSTGTTSVEPMCGNGVQEQGEECDDGNSDPADACLNNCKNAICGDDQIRADNIPEECDDGDQVDTNMCTSACKLNICRDGFLLEGVEECDDGNEVNDDECTNECKKPVCGDGMKTGSEECDEGGNNVPRGEATAEQCTTECKIACGDGTQSAMEECDDGNLEANDGCSPMCTDEYIMFVTAESYNGNLGGVAGADTICQTAATGKLMGTYVAWISVSMDNAKSDLPLGEVLIRPDGMPIVDVAEKLFADGDAVMLMNSVSLDQHGNAVTGHAWTGTSSEGTYSGSSCMSWTDTMHKLTDGGAVESKILEWTKSGDVPLFCDEEHHLYCFRKLDP